MATGAQGRVELVGFVVDERRWALPLAVVERAVAMVAIEPLPRSPDGVVGAVSVHGEIVPVYELGGRFGLPGRKRGPEAQLLLARTARRMVAVAVDATLGVVAVDDAAIVAAEPPLAGVAALPDGVLVIHDLDAFLSADQEDELVRALAEVS